MGLWATRKATDRLEDRCRVLELKVEDVERANRGLALEWEELYDKVRRQMSRMSKRYAIDHPKIANGEDLEPGAPALPDIDQVSASILRRRAMGSAKL